MSAWSWTEYSYSTGLAEKPIPSMSGAITVKRSVSAGQIGCQSKELNGYPWISKRTGPAPCCLKKTSNPR